MPGKVNPVIPEVVLQIAAQVIGNDTAITVAGSQGNFELNVRVPLIARNLLDQIRLLTSGCRIFAEKCVDGIEANEEGLRRSAEMTLSAATALNPYIGYDKAAAIAKAAHANRTSLREEALRSGVSAAEFDRLVRPERMTGSRR
ncbi:aspartate ammonia-lyase, partial [Lacticaseibacillus rhamnosus]